mgnify:FL=1
MAVVAGGDNRLPWGRRPIMYNAGTIHRIDTDIIIFARRSEAEESNLPADGVNVITSGPGGYRAS